MQYPIIAALFVVLLCLYQAYRRGLKGLTLRFESKIDGLQREIVKIENSVRKMSDKTEAVSKEITGLQHGLTSVSNQLVGLREQRTETEAMPQHETESAHLE